MSRQTQTELVISIVFFLVTLIVYSCIRWTGYWVWALLGASVAGILWICIFAWYATLSKSQLHNVPVVISHTLIVFIPLLVSGQFGWEMILIVSVFASFFGWRLYSFLEIMQREIAQRTIYYPRRIVFPYINQVIMVVMMLASLLVYFNIAPTETSANEEFELPPSVISSQIKLFEPLLSQIIPKYRTGITVEDAILNQIEEQLAASELSRQEQIQILESPEVADQVDKEVRRIENQYNVSIDPDDSVSEALARGLTQWIDRNFGGFLSPIIIAVVSSILVFIGLTFLIPLYGLLIKAGIMSITYLTERYGLIHKETETVAKTSLKI